MAARVPAQRARKTTAPAAPDVRAMVGARALDVTDGRAVVPAGDVHLVDGERRPLCGAEPVGYIFPGRDPQTIDALCSDCATATSVRRPRRVTAAAAAAS